MMTINHTLAPTPTPTHTPGPWYAKGRYILSDPLHPSVACATVLKAPSLALEPQFEAQAHANARLLAAAPDMLSLLWSIKSHLYSGASLHAGAQLFDDDMPVLAAIDHVLEQATKTGGGA